MIGAVGRVGAVGGSRGRPSVSSDALDFTLSNSSVATAWGTVQVGILTPVGIDPALVGFRIVEGTGPSGDEAGLAVVNG